MAINVGSPKTFWSSQQAQHPHYYLNVLHYKRCDILLSISFLGYFYTFFWSFFGRNDSKANLLIFYKHTFKTQQIIGTNISV